MLDQAREVFQIESSAVAAVGGRLDERFIKAVELVLACKGRVVVTGLGKSGAIGRKLASTFASTGTPALFLHAAEALHGDLGMLSTGDVLLAISYTGRTDELTSILPVAKDMQVPVIAITGKAEGYLATHSDIMLDVSVSKEACPLNLAPTSSTTASLVMGDALAICVMKARRFTHGDFARFHPGGTLGRTSKLRVEELMHSGPRLALLQEDSTVRDSLMAITEAQAGSAVVIDADGVLSGYLTDGDIRRRLLRSESADGFLAQPVAQIVTRNPLSFSPSTLAVEALRALQERRVDDAPVVDDDNKPVGVLDVQELLRAGLV